MIVYFRKHTLCARISVDYLIVREVFYSKPV
jgi:hypothetical protein